MSLKRVSSFKIATEASQFLETWNKQVEALNGFEYQRLTIQTRFGNTRVWAANLHRTDLPPVVFFPGARTCGLFWDMNKALEPFRTYCRCYLLDVNGQPSLSDGQYLNRKSQDYGYWAMQVLEGLGLARVTVVGASLGGLICLKLCLAAPDRVEKAILMNPAGIQAFSLSIRNLYYNMLPILWPTPKNVGTFLDRAIFCATHHQLPPPYRQLLEQYLVYVLQNHRFHGDYPAPLSEDELRRLTTPIDLILGQNDLLFPPQETKRLACRYVSSLGRCQILPQTGHGIETSPEALELAFSFAKPTCLPASTATDLVAKAGGQSGSATQSIHSPQIER